METRSRSSKNQRKTNDSPLDLLPSFVGFVACALVFLVPFLPDAQLIRLKLEGLELGILILLMGVGLRLIWYSSLPIKKAAPLQWVVLAWTLVNVVLWWASPEKSLATPELRRVLLAGGAYAAFAFSGISPAWKRRIYGCWFIAGSLLSMYGLLQRAGGIGMIQVPQMNRVMGTYGNPIFFAVFLLPTLFISLELISKESKVFIRAALYLGIATQLAALFYTQTRASWLALLVALAIGIFSKFGIKRIPVGVWLLVVLGLGGFAFHTKAVWQRDQGHLLIWRDTLRMWKDHPVLGVGPGAFHVNFPTYAQEDLKSKWPTGACIVNEAHNEYLQTLAETGLVGLIPFLLIPIFFFMGDSRRSWVSFGILGLFIQNLFSVDMRFGISFATCFILMGLERSESSPLESGPSFSGAPVPWRVGLSVGWVGFLLLFIFPLWRKPYRAQKMAAAAPSFFDQRLLDPAKSIGELEKLRADYPSEPALLEKLAYVYAKEIQSVDNKINVDMTNKATEAYQALIKLDPQRVAAYNNLANIFYTTGRVEEALTAWREALKADPHFLDAHLNLGKILYVRGKLKESAQHFEQVLRLDPNNAEAIVFLKRMVE